MLRKLAYLVLICGLLLRLAIILLKPRVLLIDDAFYSLGIARHIALGLGWTHDGLHNTNGFQPLYVFLLVPFYQLIQAAHPDVVPLISLVLESLCNVLTGWLLFCLITSLIGGNGAFIALLGWSFSPYVISGINGLETPIACFLLMLNTYLYVMQWRPTLLSSEVSLSKKVTSALSLGVLAGLLILARIDMLIFVAAVFAELALRFGLSSRSSRKYFISSFSVLILSCSICFSLVLLWLIASWLNTGRVDFDSGVATRLTSLAEYKGHNIVLNHWRALVPNVQLRMATVVFPWSAFVQRRYLLLSGMLMLVPMALGLIRDGHSSKALSSMTSLAFFWFFAVVLVAAYASYQFTVWNWPRYLYPLALVELILLAVWVELVLRGLEFKGKKACLNHAFYSMICLGYFLCLPFSLPADSNPLLRTEDQWVTAAQYKSADWLARNLDPTVRVGAFQSGILGYYSGHVVVNLDGVVNNAALSYYLKGETPTYLVLENVDYVVDWKVFVERLDFSQTPGVSASVIATFVGGNEVEVIRLNRMCDRTT